VRVCTLRAYRDCDIGSVFVTVEFFFRRFAGDDAMGLDSDSQSSLCFSKEQILIHPWILVVCDFFISLSVGLMVA
jgi:hypothetical protein